MYLAAYWNLHSPFTRDKAGPPPCTPKHWADQKIWKGKNIFCELGSGHMWWCLLNIHYHDCKCKSGTKLSLNMNTLQKYLRHVEISQKCNCECRIIRMGGLIGIVGKYFASKKIFWDLEIFQGVEISWECGNSVKESMGWLQERK